MSNITDSADTHPSLPRPPVRNLLLSGTLALSATVLIACGASDPVSDAPSFTTVVDTLGDTIVMRTTGDIPATEELALTEVWRVGDPDGDETTSFGFVHSIGVTDASELYVFEGSSPQFRHYDAIGALIRVIGGKGSGPGEYQRANGVTVLRDGRVALWDAGSSRINIYRADGEFLEQWRPPTTGFNTSNQSLSTLDDGRVAVVAFIRDTSLTREALGRAAWFLYDSIGTITDTILQPFFGEPPVNLISRREGNVNSMGVPFMPRPVSSLHPGGFVVGSPAATFVVHSERQGNAVRIERVTAALPIPDAERTQRREQVMYNMRRNDPAWTWDGPEIPREKPPIIGLMTTLDGVLLVSVSMPSESFEPDPPRVVEGEVPPPQLTFRSRTAYEWFGADGALRGRFTMPRGARLYAMRGSDAWGTVVDSLDVPYLVRWRVEGATNAP